MKISHRTLKRLARHVTGDWEMTPYRSGPKLVALFNEFGFDDEYPKHGGFPSRWMFAEEKLGELNGNPALRAVIEHVFDPLEARDSGIDVQPAIEDMDTYLGRDGFGLSLAPDGVAKLYDRPRQTVGPQSNVTYWPSPEKFGGSVPPAPIESMRKLKVFLCHASDDKAAARQLHQRLQDYDMAPWLDEKDLLPGQQWDREIPKAVRSSDVVIVCLSQTSTTKEGYVQKEIGVALDVAQEKPEDTIYLIPLRLESCDVPGRLSQWQWVDYFDEHGHDQLIKALVVRARQLRVRPSKGAPWDGAG